MRTIPLRESIYKRHVKDQNGCWLWTWATHPTGYGLLSHDCRVYYAHRASWIVHNGEIPGGLHVLHKYDVRRCINPDHLFLGTHKDNMADMKNKGRVNAPVGERQGSSKLTGPQVAEIRKSTKPKGELAKEYGVHRSSICRVLDRKTWKHLD